MRKMRNATANHLTFADATGNLEEVFENAKKTTESKINHCAKIECDSQDLKDWSVTTNATDEPKYVKPKWHTGYVFIVEDRLVVASSMAKAVELYCDYTGHDENSITNIRRISNEKTLVLSYDAIIEG